MIAPNSMKRTAVIHLLREGLVTCDEAAGLACTSRQLVEDWALSEGIDIATTRATYLLKIWRSQLLQERAKRGTEQELITEQMRLDQAWEKHLATRSRSGSEGKSSDRSNLHVSKLRKSKINE
jgi:hypothetical protein